jgi:prolyl oligopeptidase
VVDVFDGYDRNALHLMRLDLLTPRLEPVAPDWDALHRYVGNDGPLWYVHTTRDAPRGRIVAIDVRDPAPAKWRELVPEAAATLEGASLVGGKLVLRYLADARALVKVFDKDGKPLREVALPGIGSSEGFGGHASSAETFYAFEGFTQPRTIFRYDVATGASTPFRTIEVDADLSGYVTEQVFVTSKDGTRVPMFLVHRAGLERDGNNPTLLYGYGGFAVSLTPAFSPSRLVWLERGGVLAIANLRGGGEHGEAWHLAGTKLKKQNVFDDFIAAAEWLQANGITRPDKLAIQGGSNGGLLVGAVLNQRPELFGAALPGVGVMDMLRYHTASANARQWSSDYGLSEDPAEYRALRAYSPYHNLRNDLCYPPVLVTTADHDDRVVPWHSYKYAAALQARQAAVSGCTAPVLLRVETRSGHGAGTPTSRLIEERSDQWAFLVWALRMPR